MKDKDGMTPYKLLAFGNAWKVAYLEGRDMCIDLVLPKFNVGDTFDKPSSLCKMIFRYDSKLNGYNLIGVMELDDDISSLNNELRKDEVVNEIELDKKWDWESSGIKMPLRIHPKKSNIM